VTHDHTFLPILQWSCLEISFKELSNLNTSSVHAFRVLNLIGEFIIGKFENLLAIAILRVCLLLTLKVRIDLLEAIHRGCDVDLGQVRDTKTCEHHREIEGEAMLFQQRVYDAPQSLIATLLIVAKM
jgi:hypothetical protein